MANITIPGFQQQVNLAINNVTPGDIFGARTSVTLGANGKFALGDVNVGNFAFNCTSGVQVSSDSTSAGLSTPSVAGFVVRNAGPGAVMNNNDSSTGFGLVVPNGKQATVAINGDAAAIVTGVNSSGVANHVPVVGDILFASNTDGSLASVPAGTTTVTGYTPAYGWAVTFTGYTTNATVGANQSACKISRQVITG
jgi:hypothetical protein